MAPALSLDDVRQAARRIAPHVVRTPTAVSRTLSEITGAEVLVKFENLQFTASYKERGALNRLLLLPEGCAGVVAASAGNFAQAVAHHGARLGVPVVIVMPRSSPLVKVSRTRQLGAEVVLAGDDFEEAVARAAALADERGALQLSPFDDLDVIAGQGTVALELVEDAPEIDTVVVPTGGGGLLAGMAVALRAIRPDIEIVGVQSERYASVANALDDGARPVGGSTIAEGIAVGRPGATTVPLIRSLVDRVETVDEAQLEAAVALYLEVEKVVAEGAGGAPLAALLARPERYAGRRVALVLSGGNVDLRQLASVITRSLVRSGRLTTLLVEVPDQPGSLARITATLADEGANIIEVEHHRFDLDIHTRATEIQLVVETSDAAHLERTLAALHAAGLAARTEPPH